MDVLAHSLWTNVMYKFIPATQSDKRTTWWGIFFDVWPDLFAFGPGFIYVFYHWIFQSGYSLSQSDSMIPLNDLSLKLYNYSHSLIIWGVIVAAIWIYRRRFPWVLLGWALHIGIDLLSHTKEFYPTPWLFPLSDFHINGVSWGTPVFMIINYASLLLVYLLLIPRLRKLSI